MQLRLTGATLDLDLGEVVRSDVRTPLSATEVKLLRYLIEADVPVAADELLEQVWGYASSVVSGTVKTTVGRVRSKLEVDPKKPAHLITVSGEGYTLNAEVVVPVVEQAGLPPELDAFVGRRAELDRLAEAFGSRRIVTLLGPGGIGKTRLATAFARECGLPVVFVDASSVADAAALSVAIARALNAAEPGPTSDVVGHALGGRGECLLVLDDVSRIEETAAIAAWAAAAPEVWILLTSRRSVGAAGEAVLEVGPLPHEDAVTLLADRCTAARLDAPPDADVPWLADLAERVEGYPFALELAAAWTGVLPPEDVFGRLDLGAPLDGSWELLSDADREALAAASAFRGGFDLPGAEAVLGAEALDRVRSLRRAALLRLEGRRFGVLLVVREDAVRRLPEVAAAAARRHLDHFGQLAALRVAELRTRDRDGAIAWFATEGPNLRQAHATACDVDADAAASLTELLRPRFAGTPGWLGLVQAAVDAQPKPPWRLRVTCAAALASAGRGPEATALFQRLADEAEPADRALAQWRLGHHLMRFGDFEPGVAAIRDAFAIVEDPWLRAKILDDLGAIARRDATLAHARELYDEGVELARASGDRQLQALLLIGSGAAERELAGGDAQRGLMLLEQAEPLLLAEGGAPALSTLYEGMAAMHMTLQHRDEAREYLQKCLHQARRGGSQRKELVARWWWMLMMELNPGNHETALVEIEALMQLCGQATPPSFRAILVANRGQIAADRSEHRRARIHFDEALKMAERLDPAHQAVLWLLSGTGACAAADWARARRDLGRLVADPELGTRPGNRVALPFLALAGDEDARQRLKTWEPHTDAARAIWELVRGRVTPLGEELAQTNWGARVAHRCQARGDTVTSER